jgi:hypothetical protein
MLSVYTRHSQKCPHRDDIAWRRCRWTAFSQGLLPLCSKMSVSIRFILHIPERAFAARTHTQTRERC